MRFSSVFPLTRLSARGLNTRLRFVCAGGTDAIRRAPGVPLATQHRDQKFFPQIDLVRGLMNKTELIDHIAKQADISKAAAGRSLDALVGAVKTTLKKGGTVTLVGFGTFAVTARAARTGRNPRTGEAIKIKKAKVPKFRPGKALKDAIN
ncbi:HU family DNA-binding protein [Pigmentiphaga sp. NML080357]|nr:HU family DNA-binding protein [Pigmentiphaga sp. NML080357]